VSLKAFRATILKLSLVISTGTVVILWTTRPTGMDFGTEIMMEEQSIGARIHSTMEISAMVVPALTAIRKSLVLEALRHCEYSFIFCQ